MRQELNMADLNQGIDRAGVGDHQPHGLESQFLEGLPFLLEVLQGVVLIDAMRLEETIQLDAGQTKHLTQLRFGDASGPEFFQSKTFERPARQITPASLEPDGKVVGNLNCHFHPSTLSILAVCELDSEP